MGFLKEEMAERRTVCGKGCVCEGWALERTTCVDDRG